ncbi:MAG: ABC transporter substrate-binding protein [Candidatus Limnocylindria bacterium]
MRDLTLYRREFLRRSALAAASVAVLGCTPSVTAPGTSPTPGTTGAVGPTPTRGPTRGGTLTWGQWDRIDSIDPARTTGAAAGEVAQNIVDTLITMDADQKFYPALAQRWEIENGGQRFTFHLKDGVKTHDGATITAEAVKRTFERIRDPELNAGGVLALIAPIDTIETPDPLTVVFNMKQPYYAFMLQIWRYFFGILSPKYLDTLQSGQLAEEPVGSGPFKFVSRSADGVVTLEAFADYDWGSEQYANKGPAYLERAQFRAIPEAATRVATLESGENLLIDELSEIDYARLRTDSRFTFVESPRASHTIGFSFNVTKAPTDELAVRQAVNWAIDRKAIVDRLFSGVPKVSVGPLSHGVWSRLDELDQAYTFDPARARTILDGAGWTVGPSGPIRQKGGQPLRIELKTFRSPWTDIAEAMQAMLREVGIDLDVQRMQRAPYLELVRGYRHNMAASSSTNIDPDGILRVVYHSANRGGGSNFSNTSDPQLDALLETGRGQELGTEERRKTYEDAQRRVMELMPFVGILSQVRLQAMSAEVHGYKPGPDGLTGQPLLDVWIES